MGAGRRATLFAASVVITVATAGLASAGAIANGRTLHPTGSRAQNAKVGRLVVEGGRLPSAVVGQPYSYQFRVAGGGATAWAPLSDLPAGLALDPNTGVLSGVPREAISQQILVSARCATSTPTPATWTTGALDLLQLLAQTLAPSVSLGNQALSDILYGQDQLPSTIKGPNNAFSIFNNQANGTGTQTFAQYVSQQQGRVAEVVSILDGFLASAQQTAAGTPAARSTSSAKVPPVGDLATANAPALTYSVLAQLATGAKLDTDTVTVNPPGTQTSGLGTALTKQLSATSSARAPITKWRSPLANPGRPEHRRRRWRGQPVCASAATIEDSLDCFGRHGSERTAR
ncbi:MAG TPA: putative Ig domain-containing protein [Streptosporangiaceae bacterium]|nr:putative Ig domain-containing protein [Streptosporangiaceae bacterium]